jgi:hypothetical protein
MDLGGPGGVMLVIFLVLVLRRTSGARDRQCVGRTGWRFSTSGGTGRVMSGPVEIRQERLVCITYGEPVGEHLADWRPSTPDRVHQLFDVIPGVAASHSAIGPGLGAPDMR